MFGSLLTRFGSAPCEAQNIDYEFLPKDLGIPGTFRRHHPVFEEFEPFSGNVTNDYYIDYIGAKSLPVYVPGCHYDEKKTGLLNTSIPAVDEEYFEWIDILMSVRDAREDSYTAVELGAGFGRWGVRCGLAARRKGIRNLRLVFVEGEPQHAAWLRDHVALNNLESDSELLDCAISDQDGVTLFYVGMPEGAECNTPREWYGQSISKSYERPSANKTAPEFYHGRPVITCDSGWKVVEVEKRDSAKVIGDWGTVDLLDLDVQGEELKIITRGIRQINKKVKRIHIGTHGRDIEDGLRSLLTKNNWLCVRDYLCHQSNSTPYGEVSFVDGVQSWINPRFQLTWG
jgi:FkbM family methyltransferase